MSLPPPPALRIARLALRVTDLERAVAFYRDTLGFAANGDCRRQDMALLSLGGRELALVSADPAAAPYPEPRVANDPWFQHFAIAVSNMTEAYQRVRRSGAEPISRAGPQLLPPNTGAMTAYKFRDPEGHPLELSYDPHRAPAAAVAVTGPFLAIDHTALAVRDLGAALEFYTAVLGFAPSGRTLNRGPEQDRLDGLDGACVDIVALATARSGLRLELLHYRSPDPAPPRDVGPGDIAATRATIEVEDLRQVTDALEERRRPWTATSSSGLLARDADGHWIEVTEAYSGSK
ncbi:MAG: glyoxalase [Caulobacteraceae bacterium]|jgi:catechol 2,3-dioxygenase-like lactoylglutathione lyase family enzyme|nr:glyoxalase [Caulobacteraceae bacterium]